MFETFENYIRSKIDLHQDELKHILSLAVIRKIRRRQLLLQEGEICRHKVFICKGLLKTYRRKEDGTEYIMKFAPENSWAIDPESYHNEIPTKYNIEAVEATDIMLWSKASFHELFVSIPAFKSFSEKLMFSSIDANQDRILMNISSTTEEKYQDFIATFPDVFRRVPLHMVASYLGVSRETLSRIRHTQLKHHKHNGIS
ncbi:MAG: Crp/Fnr family transcriptional regulator [Williamsia sp.]|nr:Crp/Fnr family transcriptional regulator [Williamsia sp.]